MGWFGSQAANGFGAKTTAEQVTRGVDATGLTAIVTGGFGGLGEHTARTLATRGAHVVVAGRNVEAGNKARSEIMKELPNARIDVMQLDLASFASVRAFAYDFLKKGLPLNILINNAGIMIPPFKLSSDGIESQFATNHLGHFLLTNLLLDKIRATAHDSGIEGRIVIVSSAAHNSAYKGGILWDKFNDEKEYRAWNAYGQSKLANIQHAKELARRLKEEGVTNVTANALHPGIIATNLTRHNRFYEAIFKYVITPFIKTIPQGAATSCYVALHPGVKGVSGEYFDNCNIAKASKDATDPEIGRRLWDLSAELTSK